MTLEIIAFIVIFFPIFWLEMPIYKEIEYFVEKRIPYQKQTKFLRFLLTVNKCEFCISGWLSLILCFSIGEFLIGFIMCITAPFVTAISKKLYDYTK